MDPCDMWVPMGFHVLISSPNDDPGPVLFHEPRGPLPLLLPKLIAWR